MTHFAYPNVKRNVFIGCGRFTSQESSPGDEYTLVDKLNAGNIAEIVDTAAKLSPESSFSNYKIYFKKNTCRTICGRFAKFGISSRFDTLWTRIETQSQRYLEHREHRTKHAVETG